MPQWTLNAWTKIPFYRSRGGRRNSNADVLILIFRIFISMLFILGIVSFVQLEKNKLWQLIVHAFNTIPKKT